MPDQNDRLSDELQDYYRQMTHQPAPDVLGKVMLSTDRRPQLNGSRSGR